MLLKVPLVKNGIERLSAEVEYFIQRAQQVNRWSPRLFREDFYTSIVSESTVLEEKLRKFFREFRRLSPEDRTAVAREFFTHNAVRDLCAGVLPRTQHWQEVDSVTFPAATKDLFDWMYENTLQSATYKSFSGERLQDHYLSFRDAYGHAMCPFCGLEDYGDIHLDGFQRDAYDHYLPKQDYPFAAINPENLFPMCDHCNTRFKKAQDVIFDQGNGKCRRAIYPPDSFFEISVTVERALSLEPSVCVSLADDQCEDVVETFRTWMGVFKIQHRYEARILKSKQNWLADLIARPGAQGVPDDLGRECLAHRDELLDSWTISPQKEYQVRIPFLAYCAHSSEVVTQFIREQPQFYGYLSGRVSALAEP